MQFHSIQDQVLKSLRNVHGKLFGASKYIRFDPVEDGYNREKRAEIIYNALASDEPVMIGRLGTTELELMIDYLFQSRGDLYRKWKYIQGVTKSWQWNEKSMSMAQRHSGIFPVTKEVLNRFCSMMYTDLSEVDVLGRWQKREELIENLLPETQVHLTDVEPYYYPAKPWSRVLEGRKVLVIHPFSESIQKQYKNRHCLFDSKAILPDFELDTMQSVQSIYGIDTEFSDWFEALESMKSEIETRDFDTAILGCGAYGFSLAAHIKRMGKQAIHMGGATQILFGIKGKRWEENPYVSELMNDFWVRPLASETPSNAEKIVYGSYW